MLFAVSTAQARPEERDLGPIPVSGTAAENSTPERSRFVLREMSCADEARFVARVANVVNYVPVKATDHPDLRIGYLIAKTVALSGALPDRTCHVTQDIDPMDPAKSCVAGHQQTR